MADIRKIPERSEIPERYTWNPADIFPSDDAWQAEFNAVQTLIPGLAEYAGRLCESGKTLYEYTNMQMHISERLGRLSGYAARMNDQDTRVAEYQVMSGKISSLRFDYQRATAFATPELLAISDETMEAFYRAEPALELYRRHFDVIRSKREHILSDAEEKLLAAAGAVGHASGEIYHQIKSNDVTFEPAADSEGNLQPVSDSTYILYMSSKDRTLRRNTAKNYMDGYAKVKNGLAATLTNHMKQLQFFATARKYPNTLAAALDRSRVPEAVYRNLIETTNANLDKLHRYVRLRKKMLGVDELHMYDLLVSMVPGADQKFPYDEAVETVCEALKPLGDEYQQILRSGFENRWVDVYENVGKRSGGYAAGSGLPHPYVLLNHNDDLDSFFILAHEMGHAMHSYRSNRDQPYAYRNYEIFVAEVASTCNEALLMEHVLKNSSSKKERACYINHFLDQFKGTLYAQVLYAEFELRINDLIAAGETLTADRVSDEFLAITKKYYGPDMSYDSLATMGWARIPHFYSTYYLYQYATGYSAAIALSQRILKGGEAAVKDYLNFLSGGCSKDPIELLRGAGVDMASPKPIQDALDLFDRLLDEMEELMSE